MSPQSRWGATVGTVILLQWALVVGLSALAWLVKDLATAQSLFFGGAAVALPNSLLAAWLTLRVRQAGVVGPAAMLMGEILKLVLVIGCLVMVAVRFKPELSWLALIIGVVVALKAQWLALWMTRRY
jgi:ATP synthase protein I